MYIFLWINWDIEIEEKLLSPFSNKNIFLYKNQVDNYSNIKVIKLSY